MNLKSYIINFFYYKPCILQTDEISNTGQLTTYLFIGEDSSEKVRCHSEGYRCNQNLKCALGQAADKHDDANAAVMMRNCKQHMSTKSLQR